MTGAVKITPAHDQNDYECGKRNNLPFITMVDDSGTITGDCGPFTVYSIHINTVTNEIPKQIYSQMVMIALL